jgi:hypothetical protein
MFKIDDWNIHIKFAQNTSLFLIKNAIFGLIRFVYSSELQILLRFISSRVLIRRISPSVQVSRGKIGKIKIRVTVCVGTGEFAE